MLRISNTLMCGSGSRSAWSDFSLWCGSGFDIPTCSLSKWCESATIGLQTVHGFILNLHCERPRPSIALFWASTAPEFWFLCESWSGSCFWHWCRSDSESSFSLWCGPGSGFPKWCGSGSATLVSAPCCLGTSDDFKCFIKKIPGISLITVDRRGSGFRILSKHFRGTNVVNSSFSCIVFVSSLR